MTLALIEHESIVTTPSRAKELRWYGDRVVTWAKRGDVASRRLIVQLLGHAETSRPGENRVRNAVARVYENLVPRFKTRNGGYTQILRLAGRRPGDNAEQCILRYLEEPDEKQAKKDKTKKEKAKTGHGKNVEASSDKKAKDKKAPAEHKDGDKKASDKPAKAKKADKPTDKDKA